MTVHFLYEYCPIKSICGLYQIPTTLKMESKSAESVLCKAVVKYLVTEMIIARVTPSKLMPLSCNPKIEKSQYYVAIFRSADDIGVSRWECWDGRENC